MSSKRQVYLFTYGTLQDIEVQQATFNRILKGHKDQLNGYILAKHKIYGQYPVIKASSSPADSVTGTAYEIDITDLDAADAYETEVYKRIEVILASNRTAWVYIENKE